MTRPVTDPAPVDLATVMRRIELVSRSWPGERIDPAGCLRGVRLEGTQPPIFWTFNTAAELPALAAHMPAGQPIIGSRSLNEIVDKPTRESTRLVADVAQIYARHLLERFGTGPCIVGGNCQSAEVAWHIALHLIAAGADLRGFITLDAGWQLPLPVPVRMIFGRTSRFNPLIRGDAAAMERRHANWRALFPAYELRIIAGNHGEYFRPEHIGALATAILAPLPKTGWRPRASAQQCWGVRTGNGGWTLTLPVRQVPPGTSAVVLAPLLGRQGALPLARPDLFDVASLPERRGRYWHVRLTALAEPGPWQIAPVLCAEGIGPLNWPQGAQVLDLPAVTPTQTEPANRKGWRERFRALWNRLSGRNAGFADLGRRSRHATLEHQDFREIQFREDR
ncbi:hypothetical protein [Paracoccus sp. KR1-242]|uniref:hypothetical protein n=1 Tax=Paracoccus sp. KR1-242 TaxID=3410028 RepID=UPI003C028EA2